MTHARAALVSLVLAAALASCGITGPDVEADGTVRFLDVEGGCWGIETDDVMYEPINLPESFKTDGLEVDFEAEERDLGSFCMIGVIVELTEIERVY